MAVQGALWPQEVSEGGCGRSCGVAREGVAAMKGGVERAQEGGDLTEGCGYGGDIGAYVDDGEHGWGASASGGDAVRR